MEQSKRERLRDAGWRETTAADLLGLSAEESQYVDIRVALGRALKRSRLEARLSQQALARRMGSSQSRVARMEAAEPSVSMDLIVRAILATGASRADLARAFAPEEPLPYATTESTSVSRNPLPAGRPDTTDPLIMVSASETVATKTA